MSAECKGEKSMENVTINITGDVHIHINLDDLDDFFEDDEFDENFDDDRRNVPLNNCKGSCEDSDILFLSRHGSEHDSSVL